MLRLFPRPLLRPFAVFSHNIMDGRKIGKLLDYYRKGVQTLIHDHNLAIACIQVAA